jgi:DNA-binding MarR family transcriptional regulator
MLQPIAVDAIALRLQEQMITLIRAFGLHRPDETPCGKSVSVAEAHALMELSRNQRLSQQALSERLQLVKSTVSRVVSLLEGRGWVERRKDPHDGRAVSLYLTEQGKEAAQQLAQARQTKFMRLLERIPVEQRDSVLQALTTLAEAADERHE